MIMLTGQSLTLEQMKEVLYRKGKVFASDSSMDLVKRAVKRLRKSFLNTE